MQLPDGEARHLTHVLRLGAGDEVRVFNGLGGEFLATVAEAGRRGVYVRVSEARTPAPEPCVRVSLAMAVLKGDKLDEAVRDAVMVGAAAIVPVVAARTEASPARLARTRRVERWSRIAAAAAKQSGRATVPPVMEAADFDALPGMLRSGVLPQPAFLLVEPAFDGPALGVRDVDPRPPDAATVLVGPEGGWTHEEIDRAVQVCQPLRLGGRTLRADAAAVVALAALFSRWGEY